MKLTHHHRWDVIGLAPCKFEYLEHDGFQHTLGSILTKLHGFNVYVFHLDEGEIKPTSPVVIFHRTYLYPLPLDDARLVLSHGSGGVIDHHAQYPLFPHDPFLLIHQPE